MALAPEVERRLEKLPVSYVELELRKREVEAEIERRVREAAGDLGAFIARGTRGYVYPSWLEPVLELWRRIRAREEVRAVVEAPPRHGKTDVTLGAFAWLLTLDPHLTHAFTTYADALARSKSRKARRLAREAGVLLSGDSTSVNEWRTIAEGGLLATGVGGPLTGHGITGVGVIDDPFKNRQEADSRLIRDRVYEWYESVFSTRLEPGSSVIVQATRWHPDDLSGRLLDTGDFERIRLPAIADEPDDLLGREVGEALWPSQYPVERLEQLERTVGAYNFAALYQQRPRPRGEELFGAPSTYDPDDPELRRIFAGGFTPVAGMDAGYSGKTKSDASTIVEGRAVRSPFDGITRVYVTRVVQVRERVLAFGKRLEQLEAPYVRWRLTGAEAGTADFLEDNFDGVRITRETAKTDKFAYAQPAAAAWNDARILLPKRPGEPYDRTVSKLIDEARDFTGKDDPHDDLVDATASMWAEVADGLPSDEAARALTGH